MNSSYLDSYVNGTLERMRGGKYEGVMTIDGVALGGIEGVYFKEDGNIHLWLKRKPLLEYDAETETFRRKVRKPQWEAYLTKQRGGDVDYKGTFMFMRFKYSIVGIVDKRAPRERNKVNFYVERLPMTEQTVVNKIRERKND